MDKLIDGELYDGETGELLNEVEQVEIEVIKDTLPDIICNGGTRIQTNTEQLKKELTIYLKKYDVEVTAETEKEASKIATKLNSIANDLNEKRLQVGREIAKPAKDLKDTVDELIEIVQKQRKKVLDKVDVFKTKRFKIIRGLLEQERDKLFADLNVSEEYQFLDIEVLVKEGSLGKSNLTKNAKETLQSMVRRIKGLEDAVKIRTLELKVKCIDAGLQFPIELDEVTSFIKDDDYDVRLQQMIEARLKVEAQVKERAEKEAEEKRVLLQQEEERKALQVKENEDRAKREAEQKQQQELERIEQEKTEAIAKIQREADEKEAQRLAEIKRQEDEILEKQRIEAEEVARAEREKYEAEQRSNKKIVTIVATFKVEVGLNVHENNVLDKFEDKLKRDFPSLESVLIK